jgi:hypothetical protein
LEATIAKRPDDLRAVVLAIAQDTRDWLERIDRDGHEAALAVRASLYGFPTHFPHNWCEYTSYLLGVRLARILVRGDIDLCSVDMNGILEVHYWLRMAGLDIDITGDQFSSDLPPVLVAREHKGHAQRFPDPASVPLLARGCLADRFEQALLKLDRAMQDHRRNCCIEHEVMLWFAFEPRG